MPHSNGRDVMPKGHRHYSSSLYGYLLFFVYSVSVVDVSVQIQCTCSCFAKVSHDVTLRFIKLLCQTICCVRCMYCVMASKYKLDMIHSDCYLVIFRNQVSFIQQFNTRCRQ